MKVVVTGGYADESGECFVDELDLERGTSRRLVSHRPDADRRVGRKGFTGAVWVGESTLMVCSFNAVHRFDASSWRETGRLQQDDFNDLHHVSIEPETGMVFVCNTGLDAIEVFDGGGRFVGRHATSPAWFERERLDGRAVARGQFPELMAVGWGGARREPVWLGPSGAYYNSADPRGFHCRVVRDYLHPNHVVAVDGVLAVTMLAERAVRCWRTFRTLVETDGHPHDGQVDGKRFWTTETNGRVTAWRRTSAGPWCEYDERYEVFETGVTGWCRGLHVRRDAIVVGLTAIRTTPQYRWSSRPLDDTSTSVVVIERGSGRMLKRIDVGEAGRHAKVFSILPALA